MADQFTTRPPPPPPRVDLARLAVRGRKELPLTREESVVHRDSKPDDERLAQALAGVEGRLLEKLADMREEAEQRPSRVHVEVAPLPAEKKHWLHSVGGTLTGIAACLAGATALVAASIGLWNQVKPAPPVDYSKDIAACKDFQIKATQQFDLQLKYDTVFRSTTRGYFEAQGVKIAPAPGEPVEEQIDLLPAPLGDPHRVTKTSRVQPRDPLPLPPPAIDVPRPPAAGGR